MPKNLKQRLVGGVASVSLGLAGMVGAGMIGGGCETPEGALLARITGAAALNSQRGAVDPDYRSLATGVYELGVGSGENLRNSEMAEAVMGSRTGPERDEYRMPVLHAVAHNDPRFESNQQMIIREVREKAWKKALNLEIDCDNFVIGEWNDSNYNNKIDEGEFRRVDTREFTRYDLLERGSRIAAITYFNGSEEGKKVSLTISDEVSGEAITQSEAVISNTDPLNRDNKRCSILTSINPVKFLAIPQGTFYYHCLIKYYLNDTLVEQRFKLISSLSK
ncbi:hypothetical protein J4447_00750 [Candidatus Pacearchaeota archaeon]|nr:hypothetical protein [Candidatus Pacearchaeota archaeon]